MINKLKKLQNGSDIRGIAIDVNTKTVTLTKETASLLAFGFSQYLKKILGKENITISVGTDSRLSAKSLKFSFINSLLKENVNVIDCGLSTTPAMFMSTIFTNYKADGAIMITASHLPYYYNGFKFFTKTGGCEVADISSIIEYSATKRLPRSETGTVTPKNLIKDYSKHLIKFIRKSINSADNYKKPLDGFHIIVDAGNGAGGFFADLLQKLGAETGGSQFLNPDGSFPNHIPNPEDDKAMGSISRAVLNNHADLGIIFDTDVDRAAIVGKNGEEINRNTLIAVISSIILEKNPGATIVTDSATSDGLTKFITDLGGHHHRYKRGYRNVINEAIKITSSGGLAPLAIETSGHAAMEENHFLDDGAYLVSKILVKAAQLKSQSKNILDLISHLEMPKSSNNFRINIIDEDFVGYGKKVIEKIRELALENPTLFIVEPNYEGIKIAYKNEDVSGWFLARLSLHEPLLVVDLESNHINGVDEIEKIVWPFLLSLDKLDTRKV